MIRAMRPGDWPEVKRIYEEGIATGNATFETQAPAEQDWNREHLSCCRLVFEAGDGTLGGWLALSPVSGRCIYGGVVELTVYVAEASRGKGIGSALLDRAIPESERNGIWTLQAGVFPENAASLKLHEKAGFRTVGVREKIGKMNGRWRDVVLLERRSAKF